MSKRKTAYYRYLESGHWKALRGAVLARDNYACQKCGGDEALRVHHKRYRKDWHDSVLEDLETLCLSCHEKEHKRLRALRRANRKPRGIRHLINLLGGFSADDRITHVPNCSSKARGVSFLKKQTFLEDTI